MIAEAFTWAVNGVMERRLRNRKQRDLVVTAIMAGFAKLKRKPVQDEPQRLQKLQERVYKMSEEVSLGFVGGKLVVKVAGTSQALMTEFRRGTDWFDPWDKVDDILLAAVLVDPEK
jgi:hypothetical protein